MLVCELRGCGFESFFPTLLGLLKPTRVVSNLSTSKLSTWDFNVTESEFLSSFDVSMHAEFLNQIFLHN